MTEPTTIEPGVTIAWSCSLPDYPSAGASPWVLTYELINALHRYPITSSPNVDGIAHDVNILATDSAAYSPGLYRLAGYVASGAERHRVYLGDVLVEPNISAAEPVDARTDAQRALAAVEATLEGRATKDQVSMQIAGRAIQRHSMDELLKLRSYYRSKVDAEEGKSQGFLTNINATFGRF